MSLEMVLERYVDWIEEVLVIELGSC